MTGGGVHFRQATIDDLAVIVQNNLAMAKETEGLDLDPEVVTRGTRAALSGAAHATYYLAERGPAVGAGDVESRISSTVLAQLMITYEWSDWRDGVVWWIQSVYVDPGHRRQGCFTQLYDHVRHAARAAGAVGLRLYADVGNARAHAAYERLGMTSHYKVFEELFTDA
ncbi:hypothetical protein HT031_002077 [Scenedesmus sp. PABB004]|nr:hypothetical protein HT031_002077 [Scenedesmus sp. PABB004]